MNLKITLILLLNVLFINDLMAKDAELEACDDAVRNRQFSTAIKLSSQHLNQVEFLLCNGRAQSGAGDNAMAQQSFKQAIDLKAAGLDLISAYMLLGNAQLDAKQYENALESYNQALKHSEQQNMRRYARVAHNLIGEAYFEIGQYDESLKSFAIGEKLAMNDDERADSFVHEARTYQQLKQEDKAIEYQLKGVMMLRKSGTPVQYAEASLVLGKLFTQKKDYVSAEKTYQRLMTYAHDNGGDFYEAKTAIYLAEVKRAQGDVSGASQLIQLAEKIAHSLKDAELDELISKHKI